MFLLVFFLSWGSYDSAGDAKVAYDTHRLFFPSFYLTTFRMLMLYLSRHWGLFKQNQLEGTKKKYLSLSSIFPLQESLTYHDTFDWNQVLLWENESFWPPA